MKSGAIGDTILYNVEEYGNIQWNLWFEVSKVLQV